MPELAELRRDAAECTACELYADATQTVFGSGPTGASEAELAAVRPQLLVTLGATAAKALLGSLFRLTQHRGEILEYRTLPLVATIHPSAVLRGPKDRQAEMLDELVADLALAGRAAGDLEQPHLTQ